MAEQDESGRILLDDPPRARLPSGPIGRLLASVGNLSNMLGVVHSRYAQSQDLGVRGIRTLSAISEGHASPGDIARLGMLPPSVVSGDLNRLLDARMIERRRDGSDGRRLLYSLTENGRDVLAGAHALYVEMLGEKMASYPPGEVDRLLRVLYEISLHVRASLDEEPPRVAEAAE
jgi:DNA-binding MarR family transcriptional regulator